VVKKKKLDSTVAIRLSFGSRWGSGHSWSVLQRKN